MNEDIVTNLTERWLTSLYLLTVLQLLHPEASSLEAAAISQVWKAKTTSGPQKDQKKPKPSICLKPTRRFREIGSLSSSTWVLIGHI